MSEVTLVNVRYAETPEPRIDGDTLHLSVPTDGLRARCRLSARVTRPGIVRDSLLTLGDILATDLRFKARDRSDYLAFLLSKGKAASKELWEAQKRFLEEKYGEAAQEEAPLDPILTISQDGVAFEVFSRDESSYARLALRTGSYQVEEMAAGTTHVNFTPRLLDALGRLRSYRPTRMELVPSTEGEQRSRRVPLRWLRAFSQVQAASTLPSVSFELAPVDLYNVLLTLRMHRAKKSPRALRYELVPGAPPRLVLEPWDWVLEGTGAPYGGNTPKVVRTWGRKRLNVLARLLPHATKIRVYLVGAGLPAYYVVELPHATLTLALSGWTDSGWAGIATFDLLVAGESDDMLDQQVRNALATEPRTLTELSQLASGRAQNEIRQVLLKQMQEGVVLHDISTGQFVHRPLTAEPIDAERLKYRDAREEEAHRLLEGEGQVELTRVHDLGGEGVRIEGEVTDTKAHRTYKTSFTLDREGRTVDASCTSPQFRRSGLKEGPTVPMIALRLLYARRQAELERARGTAEGRALIRAETRVFIRRTDSGSTMYRVSLDDRQVIVRWGEHPDQLRMHRLVFTTGDEAREEYFGRLDRLAKKGFIDASAAEAV